MILTKLDTMIKGWFIGKFTPTLLAVNYEVGIKEYKKGDKESTHYHKLAKEITVIVSGKARMNDLILEKGDVVTINQGEATDFECLEDCTTVVVKSRSVIGDKYVV